MPRTNLTFGNCFLDFLDLDIAEALDSQEGLASCSVDGLESEINDWCHNRILRSRRWSVTYSNSVVPIGLEFRDFGSSDTLKT